MSNPIPESIVITSDVPPTAYQLERLVEHWTTMQQRIATLTSQLAEARKQVERLSAKFTVDEISVFKWGFSDVVCDRFNLLLSARLTPPSPAPIVIHEWFADGLEIATSYQAPPSPAPAVEGELPALDEEYHRKSMGCNSSTAMMIWARECRERQLREALGKLKESEWKLITPELKLDKDNIYLIGFYRGEQFWGDNLYGCYFQGEGHALHLLRIGRTHYRPINAPSPSHKESSK